MMLLTIRRRISIHAPARGATAVQQAYPGAGRISIHAPARGATGRARQAGQRIRFQSTLPRGERRPEDGFLIELKNFNPRSREGSDASSLSSSGRPMDFNPRSREGSDFFGFLQLRFVRISIHAPARGATKIRDATQRMTVFQSTLPRGERRTPGRRLDI